VSNAARTARDSREEPRVRILVVEDEAKTAAAVRRGLEAEGYAVDIAADGAEGLWLAEQNPYDVLILDIMLPELSGYDLCARLRAAGDWTPILMLTAKDGELDEANALDTGADDFLTKPFSFLVLLARVRALLRRGKAERPPVLAAGDLRLDPAAHRCWRGDEEVALTAREFSVLEYLLRHAGDVVSKSSILENVWDFKFDGDPNIVEVYIRHLRKKIDEPFESRLIETVRGAGYRLANDAA
jgi:DNA-binding response OmpR family regulator